MHISTLTKHHGLGNDFLVAARPRTSSRPRRRWPRAAVRPPHAASAPTACSSASRADGYAAARWCCTTPTAAAAEMSGNGIRCLAQALAAPARRPRRRSASLTDAGDRAASTLYADRRPATSSTPAVDMGAVAADRRARPAGTRSAADPTRPVAHLSVGNPHVVVGVDDVAVVDLARRSARRCPHVNVEIVEPGPEPTAITMRVHERGAGITEACGTGACASGVGRGVVGPGRRRVDGNHRAHGRRRCQGTSATSPTTGSRHARSARPRSSARSQVELTSRCSQERMSTPYNEALGATLIERTFREQIVLVGVTVARARPTTTTEASLDELALLVDTAGADEVGRMVQRRDAPDPPTYIGKGKAEELQRAVPGRRRRHRRVRQRADARRSSATSRSCSGARRSTAPR